MSPMVHPTGQLGWHAPIYVATSVPTMQALAAMPTPSVLVVVGGMLPPPMQALAVLLLPSVSVTMPPIVVPLLTATAAMPAPQIRVDSPVTSSVMTAAAQFLAPAISKGISVPAALMAAVGAMPTPSVTVGVNTPIAAPVLAANAALLTPTVGAGATIAAPLLHSTAALLTPSVGTSYSITAPLLGATAAMLTPTVTIITGPTFDALGASVPNPGNVTSLSWKHTAAAGADVYVVIAINAPGTYTTTVQYGATSMTQYGSDAKSGDGSTGIRIYRLTSAPGGLQTVTVTPSAVANLAGNSISFTGINNVSAIQTAKTALGSPNAALSQAVSCAANQIILQSFSEWGQDTITAYSGGTNRWIGNVGGAAGQGAQTLSTAIATTTFTATDTNSVYWVGAAVVLS